ncbi:sigma factor-like helix-turn-helix DNA-binding protein [Actinoplanes sp. NPDC049596]|uniref:helix-turn-helix transcriptional regulator n=1 Tax=unclassified Actinoplanes TaxID=2626549 RepID=UPI003421C3FF
MGDQFDDYYRDQFPGLARFAGALGAAGGDAREVAQRAFTDLFPVFGAVRLPAPWLRHTAMNRLPEVRGLKPAESDDLVIKVLLGLSKRQREALAWSIDGYPSPTIATVLGVEVRTARSYLRQAVERLGFLAAEAEGREREEIVLRRVGEVVGTAVAGPQDLRDGAEDVRRRAAQVRGRRGTRTSSPAVGAGAARKRALAEEAGRLADVDVRQYDASARLAEIAEEWPDAGGLDAEAEEELWDRVVAAHEVFARRKALSLDDEPPVVPGVVGAERTLRDLLARAQFDGPAWEAVARAATEYCVATVEAWLRSGHLPPEAGLDDATRASAARSWSDGELTLVASQVAGRALVSLTTGGWESSGEHTLAHELCARCAEALPDALRGYEPPEAAPSHYGPGRSAAVLLELGYSAAAVAEVLGMPDELSVTRAAAQYWKEAGDV